MAESTKHRHAFERYWRLGPERSIEALHAAMRAEGKAPSLRTLGLLWFCSLAPDSWEPDSAQGICTVASRPMSTGDPRSTIDEASMLSMHALGHREVKL